MRGYLQTKRWPWWPWCGGTCYFRKEGFYPSSMGTIQDVTILGCAGENRGFMWQTMESNDRGIVFEIILKDTSRCLYAVSGRQNFKPSMLYKDWGAHWPRLVIRGEMEVEKSHLDTFPTSCQFHFPIFWHPSLLVLKYQAIPRCPSVVQVLPCRHGIQISLFLNVFQV